jgi:CheY-like chemotaxis protein
MRQQQRRSARASPDAEAGPPTILVVEDEPLVRFWISDELRRAGFGLVEAANADEALRVLSSPLPVHLDARFHESCHKRGIHLDFQAPT